MINDNASLKKLCWNIRNNSNGIIGIDTEFIRRFTYYPILCIIQVVYFNKTENKNIKDIIDVLAQNLDLKPFFNLLKSSKIKKVIHSCSQDLDAINFIDNIRIKNLEDTQIMAEFCGYKKNIGYNDAVNNILNIDNFKKSKSIQTSNWKRRPLTKKQLEYAIDDVEYILDLYNELLKQIREYNNYNYYLNEMKYLLKFRDIKFTLKHILKKVKFMVHKKNMDYVLLIKNLLIWREEKAIENNVIRHNILTNESIQIIADIKPKTLEELKKIFPNHNDIINLKKIYKIEIINVINKFLSENNSKYKNKIYYTNENGFKHKRTLNYIYNRVNELANKKHINVYRLLNKKDIISLIMNYEKKKEILYGWKYDLLNNLFINPLQKTNK